MLISQIASVVFLLSLAALFGGMMFFPTVVAPRVFKVLDQESAGRFLRALFPAYYAFMIVTSALAGIAALILSPSIFLVHGLALFAVAVSTLAVRQILVPRINHWRDQSLAGDQAAEKRFNSSHRLSVVINMIQLLAVIGIAGHFALIQGGAL